MELNTVTISIEKYEEMKSEIAYLKEQVKQKIIIKEVLPPIYGQVALAIVVVFFFLALSH